MRHWQPIHHARWRDFVAGLAAALRGDRVSPVAVVAEAIPASVVSIAPAPAPEPVPVPASTEVIVPVFADIPEEPTLPEPPADPEPATIERVRIPPPVVNVEVPTPPVPVEVITDASPVSHSPVAQSANLTSRAFFSALGWSGLRERFSAPVPPAAIAEAISPVGEKTAATSAAFFSSLPWTGEGVLGNVIKSIRVTASRDDAGLDPRSASLPGDNPLLTGMLSAARTSDRLASRAPAPARASAYFHAIPWSR